MKISDVEIGKEYRAKVSGVMCSVKVLKKLDTRVPKFQVKNLRSGRVLTMSARRLREPPKWKKTPKLQVVQDLRAMRDTQPHAPHLVVEARAGTGKTFTLIMGIPYATGDALLWKKACKQLGFQPKPTPQQQVIWDKLKDGELPKSICYIAFNRSIVTDFEAKYSWLVSLLADHEYTLSFSTVHQLGYAAVRRAADGYVRPTRWRSTNLWKKVTGMDRRQLEGADNLLHDSAVALVSKCKLTLTEPSRDSLLRLTDHFGIELGSHKDRIFEYASDIYDLSDRIEDPIDFDDQVWLPTKLDLPIQQFGLVLGDEAQDWNAAQQAIILRAGGRIVICGDPKQAIYGWAGADTESMSFMQQKLGEMHKVEHTYLTMTFRCGHAIVEEARKIVPDFEAHESNPEGEIKRIEGDLLVDKVSDSDMLLCRVNAPLVSTCFKFIKAGRRANIKGREIGQDLLRTAKNLDSTDLSNMLVKLDDYEQLELGKIKARKNADDEAVITLQDRCECIRMLCDGAATYQEFEENINKVFKGRVCSKCGKDYGDDVASCYDCKAPTIQPEGIMLSSVHRAKGLESDNVLILHPEKMPHPMATTDWQVEQEYHLKYVAITRAIRTLTYVGV